MPEETNPVELAIAAATEVDDLVELVEAMQNMQLLDDALLLSQMNDALKMNDYSGFERAHMEAKRRDLRCSITRPNRYDHGKIYKITCNDEIYIGSTTLELWDRMQKHEQRSKTLASTKSKLYIAMRAGHKATIELLENYPCNCSTELESREQVWQDRLKPSLNNKRASRKN